ncbi:hypothetical protein [Dyadobacter sp. CY356]|nr:hypothetical protein [Dyadobacter sp. CY356]
MIFAKFPWQIILSKGYFYSFIRIAGAIFSAIAASGWMMERVMQR